MTVVPGEGQSCRQTSQSAEVVSKIRFSTRRCIEGLRLVSELMMEPKREPTKIKPGGTQKFGSYGGRADVGGVE
jgi:hypothetical protein